MTRYLSSPRTFVDWILKNLLTPGCSAIDATCGNGQDTLKLCRLCLTEGGEETIFAIDLQKEAIERTKQLLQGQLTTSQLRRVRFIHASHERFPLEAKQLPISLIIYNLGYLPGSDRSLTTQVATTLTSLEEAIKLVRTGGSILISCYPGHEEGLREEAALLKFTASLSPRSWLVSHQRWPNREACPSVLLLTKTQ